MDPEEARDEVVDRIRGGPRAFLKEVAAQANMSYDEFIKELHLYVKTDFLDLGMVNGEVDVARLWDSFELVTKIVVPKERRSNPFSCSC